MLQAWLVVAPPSKFYTVSTVLFHKYGGTNVSVTKFMSHYSMFVPTKATLKMDNLNTGHAQVIGVILCRFTNCSIIYPVVPVYYCPGHSSNTISSGALKFYIGLKRLHLNLLKIATLLTLKVVIGDHPTILATILTIFNSKFSISILTGTRILLSQLSMDIQKKISLNLFISVLVMSLSLG